jgi:hypothetical protein
MRIFLRIPENGHSQEQSPGTTPENAASAVAQLGELTSENAELLVNHLDQSPLRAIRTCCALAGDPASDVQPGPEQSVQQSARSRKRVPCWTAPVEPAGNCPGRDTGQCRGAGNVQPTVIVRQFGKSEEPACRYRLPGADCMSQCAQVLCESYLMGFACHLFSSFKTAT